MWFFRGGRRAAVALAIAFAACSPAAATTVIGKTFADLCVEADTIFAGTVESVRAQKVGGERGAIETLVRFVGLQVLAGRPRDVIELRFSGGEMDGVREEVVGMPHFRPGERVLLFVRDGVAVSPIVGFNQGDFRVVRAAGGEQVVPGRGASLPDGTAGTGSGGGDAPGMAFEEFRARVEAERERAAERRQGGE